LIAGLEVDREQMALAASDPLVLATDAAEALVRDGVPFREAHEQVAARVRAGSFVPTGTAAESVAARGAPGPGGVREALAEARSRWGVSR
jgi:argininosuccinate lyase